MTLLGTILVDGIAYGMILFLVTVGLAVTLGLMRVVNLAHGVFAMLGGYVAVYLMRQFGMRFELALVMAVAAVVVIALPVEFLLIRSVYKRSQLDQALLTIGVMFVGIALANLAFGSTLKTLTLPSYLSGAIDIGFRYIPAQRILVVAIGVLSHWHSGFCWKRRRFGNNVRATVDNAGMAAAVGVDTKLVYIIAFAIGAGLAALGGILGAEILPMEPDISDQIPCHLSRGRGGWRHAIPVRDLFRRDAARPERDRSEISGTGSLLDRLLRDCVDRAVLASTRPFREALERERRSCCNSKIRSKGAVEA